MTIACPGPTATGSEGTPRNVFSADGLTAKHEARGGAKKRLPPPRVAELIARAAYNRADVAWIARHPVLLLGESRSRKPTDHSLSPFLGSCAQDTPSLALHSGTQPHRLFSK